MEALQIQLTDDPATWSVVVAALSARIRSAPVRSLDEASAAMDVLSVLEQVRVWCGERAEAVRAAKGVGHA